LRFEKKCDKVGLIKLKNNNERNMTKIASKAKIISSVRVHDKDTGSPEVQISLLQQNIDSLSSHLKKHSKDVDAKRGLLEIVAKRRKLLNYLEKKSKKRFNALSKKIKA
jgi:small subunit ribosomal protein S15